MLTKGDQMELNIIEDKKNKMVFEITGEEHTFCNAITKEMWNVNGVKVAAYTIDHPLVGVPRIMIETDSSVEPKKALKQACANLSKKNAELAEKLKKAIK